jgi:hypothetical protein
VDDLWAELVVVGDAYVTELSTEKHLVCGVRIGPDGKCCDAVRRLQGIIKASVDQDRHRTASV